MKSLVVLVIGLSIVTADNSDHTRGNCSACKFTNSNSKAEEILRPLCGLKYQVPVKQYVYTVGICTGLRINEADTSSSLVGVLQKDIETKDMNNNHWTLGKINEAVLMAGENWAYLSYEGGDNYQNSCNKTHRKAVIMLTCKKGEYHGSLQYLEEDVKKDGEKKVSDCHYLFQLSHDSICAQEKNDGISAGGVVCIVFLTLVGTYLIVGIIYKRCAKGEKGWKQIPHNEFWKDFGNLQADGCDLLCRCGGRDSHVNHYHGIGDHQIESANDDYEESDERILPM